MRVPHPWKSLRRKLEKSALDHWSFIFIEETLKGGWLKCMHAAASGLLHEGNVSKPYIVMPLRFKSKSRVEDGYEWILIFRVVSVLGF